MSESTAVTSAVGTSWRSRGIAGVLGSRSGVVGIGLVGLMALAALLGPMVSPFDPLGGSLADRLQAPNVVHWMGTDLQGRDLLIRILYGARITLLVGVAAVSIGLLLGCIIGSATAISGRLVEGLLMRFVDVLLAFPSVLLAIAIISALGTGLVQLMVAIGVAQTGNFARLLRSRLVSVREQDFVLAARSVGVSKRRLLFVHMLPNAVTPVLVYTPLALAGAIMSIAGLGFLGLGPPDPSTPEWGSMLTDSSRFMRSAPHLLIFPGAALLITIMGFNLLGDALREALDPKLSA